MKVAFSNEVVGETQVSEEPFWFWWVMRVPTLALPLYSKPNSFPACSMLTDVVSVSGSDLSRGVML